MNYGHERYKRTHHQFHFSMPCVLIVSALFSARDAETGGKKTKLRTQCHNKQGFKKAFFQET